MVSGVGRTRAGVVFWNRCLVANEVVAWVANVVVGGGVVVVDVGRIFRRHPVVLFAWMSHETNGSPLKPDWHLQIDV